MEAVEGWLRKRGLLNMESLAEGTVAISVAAGECAFSLFSEIFLGAVLLLSGALAALHRLPNARAAFCSGDFASFRARSVFCSLRSPIVVPSFLFLPWGGL
jgi:hypothetical protein